ncbi:calmodulin-lysine N-methyltransferase [Condylostylus longicornis]|uniref:calmodulin-lysine N-methyltransferase n=1 Tax=Condylostylus longicornis TaxID=2530218 RepID=UPI00244DCFC7|nr:calmodulin-lysine N-methyltransferase [Condylostylus longicornis]XP_055387290.1 calmodulin-lysine N-methyltransferase [Condylostylus longicornis]XP_055387291.1 calmodulin-lysine N-methyltransferase [Condylostylus longicornis]XP_055387292.1 calmodulin-lysine N-methyltransferase [Condylostylus longicornis]
MSYEAVENNFETEYNNKVQFHENSNELTSNSTTRTTTLTLKNLNDFEGKNQIDFQSLLLYNNQEQKKDQGITKITLMPEYDIDNRLNSLKENKKCITCLQSSLSSSSQIKNSQNFQSHINDESTTVDEINNNEQNKKIVYKIPKISINTTNTTTSTTPTTIKPATNAKKRWNILAKVLRNGSLEDEDGLSSSDDGYSGGSSSGSGNCSDIASVRRFKTFNLLHQDSFEDYTSLNIIGKPENWYTYKIYLNNNEYIANIHHVDRHLTATDLMGFNNTGNICVWPSEEALTVYTLNDLNIFRDKWILELGGGMTCLTGILLAKYAKPYIVHLTDGNCLSIDNVRKTICLNDLSCYTKCSVLKWENVKNRLENEYEKFDYILSADCLFFDDVRSALVETIWYYLSINGIALVMAPERGNTMKQFINECNIKGFQYQKIYHYNDIIWEKHINLKKTNSFYDEDIHYPILIKLTKPKLI